MSSAVASGVGANQLTIAWAVERFLEYDQPSLPSQHAADMHDDAQYRTMLRLEAAYTHATHALCVFIGTTLKDQPSVFVESIVAVQDTRVQDQIAKSCLAVCRSCMELRLDGRMKRVIASRCVMRRHFRAS